MKTTRTEGYASECGEGENDFSMQIQANCIQFEGIPGNNGCS